MVDPIITLVFGKPGKRADVYLKLFDFNNTQNQASREVVQKALYHGLIQCLNDQQLRNKKFYNYFLAPTVNALRVARTFRVDRYIKAVLPCVHQLIFFVFTLVEFNPLLLRMLGQECDRMLDEFAFWDAEFEVENKAQELMEDPESRFVRMVVCGLVKSFMRQMESGLDLDSWIENFRVEISKRLNEQIEKFLTFFVIIKLKTCSKMDFVELDLEFVCKEALDLVWNALLMLRSVVPGSSCEPVRDLLRQSKEESLNVIMG